MQKRWRLSKYRVKRILECFCVDIPAGKTASLLGYNRHTAERYFTLFREHILEYQHQRLMLVLQDMFPENIKIAVNRPAVIPQ